VPQIRRYPPKLSAPCSTGWTCTWKYAGADSRVAHEQPSTESSAAIRAVCWPRGAQQVRYRDDGIYTNAQLKPRLVKRIVGSRRPQELLEQAMARLNLSARAHGRILRVARTIADLADSDKIETVHVAEAIQYRALDRAIEV